MGGPGLGPTWVGGRRPRGRSLGRCSDRFTCSVRVYSPFLRMARVAPSLNPALGPACAGLHEGGAAVMAGLWVAPGAALLEALERGPPAAGSLQHAPCSATHGLASGITYRAWSSYPSHTCPMPPPTRPPPACRAKQRMDAQLEKKVAHLVQSAGAKPCSCPKCSKAVCKIGARFACFARSPWRCMHVGEGVCV